MQGDGLRGRDAGREGSGAERGVRALIAHPPPDVIRTGGPSRPVDSKVAIVATARNMVGKTFRVLDASGQTVLTAKVTRVPGTASPWKHAAQADLSAVTAPGSY